MARLAKLLLVVLVLALGAGAWFARGALEVAVGYSAKQACSGVFVAGLPESFLLERDIRPRMAILGPLLPALDVAVDRSAGSAEASLFGVSARAVYGVARGCSLHGEPMESASPREQDAARAARTVRVGGIYDALDPIVAKPLMAAMDAAFQEPGGRNTLALLVSHRGQLIAQRYAEPVDETTPMQGWSMNKSLMATWVGMQAGAGELDPSSPLRTQVEEEPLVAALDERLTLLHLLQMESGLDFEEVYGPGSDVTRMLYRESAMWTVPASSGQAYAPGQHFAYSSGDTVLASLFWQRSLGMPYEQWIETRFKAPLGVASLVAEADASGVQVGSSYVYLTARDWMTVGHLWLDAWHGRSDLLSQEWLRASVAPRPSDEQGRYGRGFWLNTDGVVFSGLPDSLFYAGGNAGQFVIVVPEWELVVVRLGLTEPTTSSGVHDFLLSLAALRDLLPGNAMKQSSQGMQASQPTLAESSDL